MLGPDVNRKSPDSGPLLRVPPEAFFTPPLHLRVLPLACHGSLGTSLPFSELSLSSLSNGLLILPSNEVMGMRVLCQLQGSVEMRGLMVQNRNSYVVILIASKPQAQVAPVPDPQVFGG